MGKLDFNLDEEEMLPVKSSQNLPAAQRLITPEAVHAVGNAGIDVALANACPPLALVSMAIQAVKDIVPAIASMHQNIRMAEEMTKQTEAQANMRIRMAEEQTKQVYITQTERTKQVFIECETHIREQEIELKKLEVQLRQRQNEIMTKQKSFDWAMQQTEKQVDLLIDTISKLSNLGLKENFLEINNCMQKLVELNKQMVDVYKAYSVSDNAGGLI